MAVHKINFFEQHCEKIAVGVAAAGLLGIIAWQFIDTSTITLGTEKDMPLSKVYPTLESAAASVKTDLTRREPALPTIPDPTLKTDFETRRNKPVAPAVLAWTLPPPPSIGPGTTTPGPSLDVTVRTPSLAAPARPVAASFMTTIDPAELAHAPELAKYVPAQSPLDKAAVSIETTFDGSAFRAEFEAAGADSKVRAMPRNWWAQTEVVKVEVLRRELKADGSWSDPVAITAMPGRIDLLKDAATTPIEDLIKAARDHRDQILRPEFYQRAVIEGYSVGDEWVPPSEQDSADDKDQEKQKLRSELRKVERDIARWESEIQSRTQNQPRNNPPGGGPGRGPGGPGGAAPPGGNRPPGGAAATEDPQIKRLRDLVSKAQTRAEEIRKTLADAGAAQKPKTVAPPIDRDLSPILIDKETRVWAHDIDAKRGHTYSYRVRINVVNPLYGQGEFLKAEDKGRSRQTLLASAESEWSDPVKVDPEVYYFVTSVQEKSELNAVSSATTDLFTFTWGYWRRVRVSTEPGDALVGRVAVPDSTKITVDAPAAEQPGQNNPPPMPGGPGRQPMPMPGGGGPQGPTNPPAAEPKPLPKIDQTIAVDAFMLDVATSPETVMGVGGAERRSLLVFMREPDGRIVARRPEQQRTENEFKRLSRSADKGEQQMKGQLSGEKAPPPAPKPPVGPAPINPRPGGGGGGGGGGS